MVYRKSPKRQRIIESKRRRQRAIKQLWWFDLLFAVGVLVLGFTLGPWQLGLLFGLPLLCFALHDFGKYPEPGPHVRAFHERQRRHWDELDRRYGAKSRKPTE